MFQVDNRIDGLPTYDFVVGVFRAIPVFHVAPRRFLFFFPFFFAVARGRQTVVSMTLAISCWKQYCHLRADWGGNLRH